MSFENKGKIMIIGYARVSTQEQNLSLQVDALKNVGCEKIYEDQISGSKSEREGLRAAFENLRSDDTFVVWKLDRLGRSLKHLITLVNQLEERGVHFKSITDSIDTSTAAGKFFFHVMASLAEMERELIKERTKAGLEAARLKGRIGGRKRAMTNSKIASAKKLLKAGALAKDVAADLNISVATLYRYIPAAQQLIDD